MEGNGGKTLFYALTCCGKIVFTLTLIYLVRQQARTEEEGGRGTREKIIIRCGTRIERKTERALHLHFNLSFKTARKPSH